MGFIAAYGLGGVDGLGGENEEDERAVEGMRRSVHLKTHVYRFSAWDFPCL